MKCIKYPSTDCPESAFDQCRECVRKDEDRSADRAAHAEMIVGDLDRLRHMLGATRKPRDFGFRNYYNTSEAGPDVDSMRRLERLGLVVPGRPDYWHATEAGCRAIGFNAKQIKRALHDE